MAPCNACHSTGRGLFGGPCGACQGAGRVGNFAAAVQAIVLIALVVVVLIVVFL